MKFSVAAIVLVLAFAALPARAADEPEAVYARFHRAAASGNLEEMLRHAPDAQRAELAGMSQAQKDAAVKMVAAMLPRAFLLRNKSVTPDGKAARLLVEGPGQIVIGDKPEMLYGTIRLVMERGEWKVAETSWNNSPPAAIQAAPAPRAPAPAAAQKSGAPARTVPVVGSLNAAPERKLGTAKPPCVFKPVMTAEDMENCR